MRLLIVALALGLAGPSSAATYNVHIEGVLVSQNSLGIDPNLSVGDTITLSARFDDSRVVQWGDFGYTVAGLYNLPAASGWFYRVEAPGAEWSDLAELDDGYPFFTEDLYPNVREFANPAIVFQNGKVIGLTGALWPQTGTLPVLEMGSKPGFGYLGNGGHPDEPITSNFTAFDLSSGFSVSENSLYPSLFLGSRRDGLWRSADHGASHVALFRKVIPVWLALVKPLVVEQPLSIHVLLVNGKSAPIR